MGLTLGVGVGMSSETVESDVSAVPNQESQSKSGVTKSQGADVTRHPRNISVPVHPPAASFC